MVLAQALVQEIAARVLGATRVTFQGHALELGGEWRRVSLRDAIAAATGIDVLAHAELASCARAVRARGFDPGDAPSWAGSSTICSASTWSRR